MPFTIHEVVIKASAASEIRTLIAALGGHDDVMREAAIARLAVIGSRAVEKLVAAYAATPDARTRVGILRALEPMGDRRAIGVAQNALSGGGEEAWTATAVLRGLLDSPHLPAATAALDTLVATALDASARRGVRQAALDALQVTSPAVQARVAAALASDPDVRAAAPVGGMADAAAAETFWLDLTAGRLPDEPAAIAAALHARASSAALTSLQKIVDAIRAKESLVRRPAARAEWRNVRGLLHQALARRGSKVALYDLRETLEQTAEPLPVSFLAALQVVGDGSCLEPIAAAYVRARPADVWWRQQLKAAFQAICQRERITKRHAVLKRVASRCPELIR